MQQRLEDMLKFLHEKASVAVCFLFAWHHAIYWAYAFEMRSSKRTSRPKKPRRASQTIVDAAMSFPKPMWNVCATSGYNRCGDSAPGILQSGESLDLNGGV